MRLGIGPGNMASEQSESNLKDTGQAHRRSGFKLYPGPTGEFSARLSKLGRGKLLHPSRDVEPGPAGPAVLRGFQTLRSAKSRGQLSAALAAGDRGGGGGCAAGRRCGPADRAAISEI